MTVREVTRIRERGTHVTIPKTGAKRIEALREILRRRQYAKIDGVMVDGFTASAIVQVYDALNDTNKAKYREYTVGRMADLAWKMIKKNPARRRMKKRSRSERGFFPSHRFVKQKLHGRGRLVKRKRNPAIRLTWHEFAGGTAAAEGKNSYQAITGGLNGREQYLIDPISWPNGRHRYYKLQYFGVGGYRTLGTNARVATLKKMAAEHFLGVVLTATNPRRRRRNPATRIKRSRTMTAQGAKAITQLKRHQRRSHGIDKSAPFHTQVKRGERWVTLGRFSFKASATDYGRALKHRYPSKSFRVFW
jgi:hypothetical protein